MAAAAAASSVPLSDGYKRNVFGDVMWVNMPLLVPGRTVLETDVKIRLRVTRAYSKYGTGDQVASGSLVVGESYFVEHGPVTHNAISRGVGTSFVAANATWTATVANPSVLSTINKADPIYEFNTDDIGTHKEDAIAAEDALSLINIVPNPYYAYSGYEERQVIML